MLVKGVTKDLTEVASIRWWNVYNCDCIDKSVEEFTKLICIILDREDMAPMETFQQRNNYCRTPDQTKIKIKSNQKSGEAL